MDSTTRIAQPALGALALLFALAPNSPAQVPCQILPDGPFAGAISALHGSAALDGPALYAAGTFSLAGEATTQGMARFDGATWTALPGAITGAGASVQCFAIHDDGGGPALYAAGTFDTIGGVPAKNVAKWDGRRWIALGAGIPDVLPFSVVRDMVSFDDGTGPALYATGNFDIAGTTPAARIARWNGERWEPVGGGLAGGLGLDLCVHDDGGGDRLYVGGTFTKAGGRAFPSIARWDGNAWEDVGGSLPGTFFFFPAVVGLVSVSNGNTAELYAAGSFVAPHHGATRVARWNGAEWVPCERAFVGNVDRISVARRGDRNVPVVSGAMVTPFGDGTVQTLLAWDGEDWGPLADDFDAAVLAMASADVGDGPRLFLATDEPARRLVHADACANAPESFGHASLGAGGVSPTLTAGGVPTVGNPDFSLELENAIGGSLAHFMVGSSAISSSMPWGTLFAGSAVTSLVPTSGPERARGVGTASLRVPIPHDASLVGTAYFAQVTIDDGMSSGSASHTKGLCFSIVP